MTTSPLRLTEKTNLIVRLFREIVRKIKHLACRNMFGGHELYVVRNDPMKLFQECLLCGYTTKGWTLDPRNRRLHVIKPESVAVRPCNLGVQKMNAIRTPKTQAERIVNAILRDLYERDGFEAWWNHIEDSIVEKEIIPELVNIVDVELKLGRE